MVIAVCDDCARDRELVKDCCERSGIGDDNEYRLFSSGAELLSDTKNGAGYDIVFLDVDMPYIDGIETGKMLRRNNEKAVIIFITNHPEYALDAFECEAFHYLLKPCDQSKLTEVLARAVKRLGILHQYHIVKTRDRTVRLPISEIYYIECFRRHIIYHMKDEDITARENLSSVYTALKEFGFFQVHQGYIVNMDKIKSIEKDSVILDDGRSVMMSVRKKSDVFLAYSKYVENFTR